MTILIQRGMWLLPLLGQKKYSFVSGAPGGEKNSHAGGRKNIFFEIFKEYVDQ